MRLHWHRGDVLRKVREYKGWTQGELAEAAGVSIATVGRVEAGQNYDPLKLGSILSALGLAEADMFAAIPKSTYELPDIVQLKHLGRPRGRAFSGKARPGEPASPASRRRREKKAV